MVTGLTGDGLGALCLGLILTMVFSYTNTALFEFFILDDYVQNSRLGRLIIFCISFGLGLAVSIIAAFVCS